jgi:thiamine-phosphate pyrophosphorylase
MAINEKKMSIPSLVVPSSCFRIIDANLNRCREGLRVIEDSLRFVLNDCIFYKKIRNIRHNVDKILRSKHGKLIAERDSIEDVGREVLEPSKRKMQEVVTANFKRAQESLRVLEEYSKNFVQEFSAEFKKQRYLLYVAEKLIYLKYKFFFVEDINNYKE